MEPEISDQKSLEAWLRAHRPEMAVAVATRSALRVVPLVVRAALKSPSGKAISQFSALAAAVFRASALARIAAKYPTDANDTPSAAEGSRANGYAAQAARAAADAASAVDTAAASAVFAVADVARAASDAYGAFTGFMGAAADVANSAVQAVTHASSAAGAAADAVLWREVRNDVEAAYQFSSSELVDSRLWSRGSPDWAKEAWQRLGATLPKNEGWDVWIEWYDKRLHGGSRGQAYEVVFATVPWDVWNKSPAETNLWIKEHMP